MTTTTVEVLAAADEEVLSREALDFVVANHLLEHLVNPVRFLEQCYQVLAPGGLLFLGLPDKRRIFDRFRRRTTLSDLLARYEAGTTEVTEEQVAEFLQGAHSFLWQRW